MNRFTWQELSDFYSGLPLDLRERREAAVTILAIRTAQQFFGDSWVQRHLNPEIRRPGFFRIIPEEIDPDMSRLTAFKLIDLAELLLNLQDIPGFSDCVKRMGDGDLEGSLAELDIARMIFINDWKFRFVEPSGQKGADYDFEITLSDELVLCADAKCKIESTELNEGTIRNALNDARKQFPKDRPSAVLVKFPSAWRKASNLKDVVTTATKEFFARTQRIVVVSFYTTPHEIVDSNFLMQGHEFLEISNASNRFDRNRDWRLFNRWRPNPASPDALYPKWGRVTKFGYK